MKCNLEFTAIWIIIYNPSQPWNHKTENVCTWFCWLFGNFPVYCTESPYTSTADGGQVSTPCFRLPASLTSVDTFPFQVVTINSFLKRKAPFCSSCLYCTKHARVWKRLLCTACINEHIMASPYLFICMSHLQNYCINFKWCDVNKNVSGEFNCSSYRKNIVQNLT
jgi:hypothetical protein